MAPLDSLVNISLYTALVTSCKVQQSGTACMAPLDGTVAQWYRWYGTARWCCGTVAQWYRRYGTARYTWQDNWFLLQLVAELMTSLALGRGGNYLKLLIPRHFWVQFYI